MIDASREELLDAVRWILAQYNTTSVPLSEFIVDSLLETYCISRGETDEELEEHFAEIKRLRHAK